MADNEKRVQWVAETDWQYRCRFTCSAELLAEEHIWLVCDGLDTLATVTLNGHELGRHRKYVPPVPLGGRSPYCALRMRQASQP